MTRRALGVFVLALIVRLIFLAALAPQGDAALIVGGDSEAYVGIAENLAESGTYASTEALIPDNHRPPLYPLFLVPFVKLGASLSLVALVQDVLVSLAVLFLYLLGRSVFGERVALSAAALLALEPFGAYLSNLMLSEGLFLFLFTPSVLLLARYLKTRSPRDLYVGALLLGLSALTRSLALYLVFLIPLVALIESPRRFAWRETLIALALFVLVLSPWLYWNAVTFGSVQFSSTGSRNLYQDNATLFERWRYPDREPFFTIENRAAIVGEENVQTVEGAHALGRVARDFILEHPLSYGVFHILYVPRLFIHDGYLEMYERLSGRDTALTSLSIYDDLAQRDFRGALEQLREHPALLAPLVPKLFFAFVSLLALASALLAYRFGDHSLFKVSLFLTALLVAYAFLVSPVGQARLRLAIHPPLFLLASCSFWTLRMWYRERSRAVHPKSV